MLQENQELTEQILNRFVRTSANFRATITTDDFEITTGTSQTVPEMTIDLRLLINRRANGMAVPQFDNGYSEEDYPDIYKMDEVELIQYRQELAEQMAKMNDELHVASKRLELEHDEKRKKDVTIPEVKPEEK